MPSISIPFKMLQVPPDKRLCSILWYDEDPASQGGTILLHEPLNQFQLMALEPNLGVNQAFMHNFLFIDSHHLVVILFHREKEVESGHARIVFSTKSPESWADGLNDLSFCSRIPVFQIKLGQSLKAGCVLRSLLVQMEPQASRM
ncbi:MAG TPA: hypothetical protein VE954_35940 [Oligoflexus sp.]|uniref:hypothetical protein n=1 Tax=Oligoflexus sp. TaxID=1971216 RepID=UPI002D47F78B|nr:hypothetical protein [Oligoflexus sp.]HYX38525.1 hypothetical protein [Oligoflexus sp.]